MLATCRPDRVHELVAETIPESQYSKYEVKLLANTSTDASIHDVECAVCGNQVVSENGVATRIGGTLYHFCCKRCETDFEEKYETFRENTYSTASLR